MNRAERRKIVRALHRQGCQCAAPRLAYMRTAGGATFGVAVTHQTGCPQGDAVLPLNALGLAPMTGLIGRCER